VKLKTVRVVFERTANFVTPPNRKNPNILIWWRKWAYLQNCNIYIRCLQILSQNIVFSNVLSIQFVGWVKKVK
jgi:hypothetical protein